MNTLDECRDAAACLDASRRQNEADEELAYQHEKDDELVCEQDRLERFADDGGSWLSAKESDEVYFKKSQVVER